MVVTTVLYDGPVCRQKKNRAQHTLDLMVEIVMKDVACRSERRRS